LPFAGPISNTINATLENVNIRGRVNFHIDFYIVSKQFN